MSDDDFDESPLRWSDRHEAESRKQVEQDIARELEGIAWFGPPDLREWSLERPEFIWEGLVGVGMVTIVAGRGKLAGKSEFLWALIRALRGQESMFCGREIASCPVVFLSEEPGATLRGKVEGIDDGVRLIWRETMPWPPRSWEVIVQGAAAECARTSSKLLVIDTFTTWARLDADAEKDAGAVARAMGVLSEVCGTHGIAVVLVHHSTKLGEFTETTDVRGAGAFTDMADIAITMARIRDGSPRQRGLNIISRWSGTPDLMIVEMLADGAWKLITQGEQETARTEARRNALRATFAFLPAGPPGWATGAVADELGLSAVAARKKLEAGEEHGVIAREGERGRGRKVSWFRVPEAP